MRRKTASGHFIGQDFPEQHEKTLLQTLLIRRINESDLTLTPAEQAKVIKILPGLSSYEMEALIPISGPVLVDSIRKIISKGRAVPRSQKRKRIQKSKRPIAPKAKKNKNFPGLRN